MPGSSFVATINRAQQQSHVYEPTLLTTGGTCGCTAAYIYIRMTRA